MSKNSYYVSKTKKKKETMFLELEKLKGYTVKPNVQVDDMIGVNLKTLEKSIKRTNKLENWDKERDILYYRFADKKMIGGWGSEVEIDNFDYDSLKLK